MTGLKVIKQCILFLLLVVVFSGCSTKKRIIIIENDKAVKNLQVLDTVSSLANELKEGRYVFETLKGNYKEFIVSDIVEDFDILDYEALTNNKCEGEDFDGSRRPNVKTTPSRAVLQKDVSIIQLLNELKKSERRLCKGISKSYDERVPEEEQNIELLELYLYTFSRQRDEDYHLIVGTTSNVETSIFFNIEVSALPKIGNYGYEKIKKVRETFENEFQLVGVCKPSWNYYNNDFRPAPRKISIKGSLFYDPEHCTESKLARTGPQKWKKDIRLSTAWEIHPVTYLEFLD